MNVQTIRLNLDTNKADDVMWSYKVVGANGKERTLSLDGRIILDKQGFIDTSPYTSTFSFFKQVVGFDFVEFMNNNQEYFKEKIQHVLIFTVLLFQPKKYMLM